MITSPEPSAKLSDEQTKQLQVFYTRLTNLQTETSIANKNLEAAKQELVRVSMEKQATEESLQGLKAQVATLKTQAEEHIAASSKSHAEMDKQRKERDQIEKHHTTKDQELSARERALQDKELAHAEATATLNRKSKELSDERLSVEKAKQAFLKSIEAVTW